MGGMPGHIAKVPISKRIDDLSRDPVKRDAFLEDLKDWKQDYFDVLVKHGVLKRNDSRQSAKKDDEYQHYRKHWFNYDHKGWWRDHPHVAHFERIHRQGMIEAFQEAQNRNLPIDTYWICFGPAKPVQCEHVERPIIGPFEICVTWNENQITRIILTPGMPMDPDPDSLTAEEPFVVVKYGERGKGEDEVERNTKGQWVPLSNPASGERMRIVRPWMFPYD